MLPGWAVVHYPTDQIMAPPAFVRQVREWALQVFAGRTVRTDRVPIRLVRQDHSVLRFGRSCIETPLRIGTKSYERGLGTHAVSEIEVTLPQNAVRFEAEVGVDNNEDTGGRRGSVEFLVDVDGEEALRTPVLRGGMPPVPVMVRLASGSKTLRLRVTDGGDGVAYDQADWADARLVLGDGTTVFLDENRLNLPLAGEKLPLSFRLGGRTSDDLLPTWERSVDVSHESGFERIRSRWKDPSSGMVLEIEARVFDRYPAVDWVAWFTNEGSADSETLEDVRVLDMTLASGFVRIPVRVRRLNGDTCSATSFRPIVDEVEPGKTLELAPQGGRPSSMTAFPFWNIEYHDGGVLTGLGWTGQWHAEFQRSDSGPTAMRAGMERLRTYIRPGERIRTPRVLIMPWTGARTDAHVRFRRLMMEHFTPRHEGRVPVPPLAMQTFDRYHATDGWATESGQLVYARTAADLRFDSLWLDAAWFPGGFPNGVGSWYAEPRRFPRGLKPIADAVHARGMRFVLWFEPERVAKGSQIATEHPEWVHGGAEGGLFKLENPEARRWLTDLLIARIREYGVDVYRNDFNMDPLPYWRAADEPGREGMTEIRYVEGLYEMWDALLAANPGLLIDNCSSGGRRLDLEMMMRSVPLWRSDTGCWPGHPEWNQQQTIALAGYLPLFTVGLWSAAPYERRSAATAGVPIEVPYLDAGYHPEPFREAVAEIASLRDLWFGDFYPLSRADADPEGFAGWQLHRPDLNEGAVYLFRRPECGLSGVLVSLRGVRPGMQYEVHWLTETGKPRKEVLSGRELQNGLAIRIDKPGESVIVRYRPAQTARQPSMGAGKGKPAPTKKQGR